MRLQNPETPDPANITAPVYLEQLGTLCWIYRGPQHSRERSDPPGGRKIIFLIAGKLDFCRSYRPGAPRSSNLRKLQRRHSQNGLRSTSKMDFIVTWQPAATICA